MISIYLPALFASSATASGVPETKHASVMVREVLEILAPGPRMRMLDATAGQGGHSEALLSAAPDTHLVALDADPASVAIASERLARFGKRAEVIEANFGDIARVVAGPIDLALFDLGWNRGQLVAGRGLSFVGDEPLDMRYGAEPRSGFTAADILNRWSEEAIANVLFGYGEERYARRIARAVIVAREHASITTTAQFVEIIKGAVPALYARGRTHPATKSFQALRVAVNDELRVIEEGVVAAWRLLSPGGRIAVITFHSVEDRVVKHLFRRLVAEEGGRHLTKKPLSPSREEVIINPSARSAKLRGIQHA